MFLTITLNPILDKTIVVNSANLGNILRIKETSEIVGGKGNNVARTIKKLGYPVVASGFIGGYIGKRIKDLMKQEGIKTNFVFVKELTRLGITLRELQSGRYTHYLDPNTKISKIEIKNLIIKISKSIKKYKVLILSGSSPCKLSDNIYKKLLKIAHKNNLLTILDSYGKTFKLAISEKPFMIKLNLEELEIYLKKEIKNKKEIILSIKNFSNKGIKLVVITLGEKGAFIGFNDKIWQITPPKVKEVNAIGSGDALVGGMAIGIYENFPIEKIIRLGISCSIANVKVWEPIGFSYEDVEKILPTIKIKLVK
ncbi:MAG: hexose kinase [bacterium]